MLRYIFMSDETTDESNAEGKETNNDVTPVKRVTENYDKLKEANDKVEAELLRGEELKAKITLGGNTTAGQEAEKPKEETDEEFTEKFERGEIDLTK